MSEQSFADEANRVIGNEKAIDKALSKSTGQGLVQKASAAALAIGLVASPVTGPTIREHAAVGAESVGSAVVGTADKITTGVDHTFNAAVAPIEGASDALENTFGEKDPSVMNISLEDGMLNYTAYSTRYVMDDDEIPPVILSGTINL